MASNYSQFKAMLAITRASLQSMLRSPQAVFFSLFFPVVLIVIFGAIGGGKGVKLDVAFDKNSDTVNVLYPMLKTLPVLNVKDGDEAKLQDDLKKGRITALIDIQKNDSTKKEAFNIHLKTTSASQRDMPVLEAVLKDAINDVNNDLNHSAHNYAAISKEEVPGREYKMIDFYLPGMLGFSLIGSAVFGVAFLFFSLRDTLVLKRMYSTPVSKRYIVLGESFGRVIFQMATAVIIILFGKYLYGFTLANGIFTFINLLLLSLLGLLTFMAFGFIVSSVAKNQSVIPIYANLFMFPQYFLSGTFFPKSLLPQGLQAVIKFLPLTALNDAMRKVSFEGLNISGVGTEILILLVWCVLAFTIAIRVFRWE